MKKPQIINLIPPFALFSIFLILSFFSGGVNTPFFLAKFCWLFFISCLGFVIFKTKKIYPYRLLLFILIAVFFFLEFKLFRFLKFETGAASYCHIALVPALVNFMQAQFLALASGNWHIWGVLTLGFLWLLLIVTIGQGICSWVCFYGGIDEAFSKILPKPLVNLNISKKWRDFPLAFLLFLLIISFLQQAAVFCLWFCPLKMTPSFGENQFLARNLEILFFVFILAVFLILLPILTKKRAFCAFICPFGAFISVCGKISPYRVTIDKEKCTRCAKCVVKCPVLAIDKHDLAKCYQISSYCNRCGKCIDICPVGAIDITILNKAESAPLAGRVFIFVSLLLAGVISVNFVPSAITKIAAMLIKWFR